MRLSYLTGILALLLIIFSFSAYADVNDHIDSNIIKSRAICNKHIAPIIIELPGTVIMTNPPKHFYDSGWETCEIIDLIYENQIEEFSRKYKNEEDKRDSEFLGKVLSKYSDKEIK